MDNNDIFSNTMLGLEMSLNHQQTPNFHHQQPPLKQTYPYGNKQRASPISDEEEHQSNNLNIPATTDDSGGGDGRLRKGSPWQRMKWTDNMVRLLIMVVFYVGDEGVSDQPPGSDAAAAKKKSGGGGGGGGLQKKGKWKSVSLGMMERGFYVSPQQCEDKFNDLNKRYKRVNDILGKGTACKVVENQSLLESMEHIPAKLKEEVKKLLNSKHLFFREMCAYHNSCSNTTATATTGGGGVAGSGEQNPHHRQKCVHSNDEDEEDEDDGDGDGDDEVEDDGGDEVEDDGLSCRKRVRAAENDGDDGMMHQFNNELGCVMQDLGKSVWEKRQWMRVKMMQLEEQRVGYQCESYELEKKRLKWLKFSYSKEREMEVEKMKNERMKLENERMMVLLKQKEMEMVDLQQQYSSNVHHNKRTSDPSSING